MRCVGSGWESCEGGNIYWRMILIVRGDIGLGVIER